MTDKPQFTVLAVFPDGVTVKEMREFRGDMYVATSNGVYLVVGDKLRLLKMED